MPESSSVSPSASPSKSPSLSPSVSSSPSDSPSASPSTPPPPDLRVTQQAVEILYSTGKPADLLVANTFAMAVRLPRGQHVVRLSFSTPGAGTGLWISAASAVLLALATLRVRASSIALRTAA